MALKFVHRAFFELIRAYAIEHDGDLIPFSKAHELTGLSIQTIANYFAILKRENMFVITQTSSGSRPAKIEIRG